MDNIGLITASDRHYAPVAELTGAINSLYCLSHGYDFSSIWLAGIESWPEKVWQKIPILQSYLREGFHEWLMWIDADALIMNQKITIETLIGLTPPDTQLIACRDYESMGINAGVLLLKNCEDSLKFLDAVESKKDQFINHRYPEQDAMGDSLHLLKVSYLPHWSLNSFWLSWVPGDFVAHHAGGSVEDKVKGLTPFLDKVIR